MEGFFNQISRKKRTKEFYSLISRFKILLTANINLYPNNRIKNKFSHEILSNKIFGFFVFFSLFVVI